MIVLKDNQFKFCASSFLAVSKQLPARLAFIATILRARARIQPMLVVPRACSSLLRREPRQLSRRWQAVNYRGFASVQDAVPNSKANARVQSFARKHSSHSSPQTGTNPGSVQIGTILFKGTLPVEPEDAIAQIPTLAASDPAEAKTHHAVLLVTRSHARWLADYEAFLHPTLRKIFVGDTSHTRQLHPDSKVDVLSMVVDKLPDFSLQTDSTDSFGSDFDPLREADGVAFYVSDAPCVLPDLWDVVDLGPQKLRIGDKRQSTVSFTFASDLPTSADSSGDKSLVVTSLKLPLANTIFQTGSEFTIFASRWKLLSDQTDLEVEWSLEPTHRTINLPLKGHEDGSSGSEAHDQGSSSMAFPMIPLTSRREIKSGMGNIIRQLVDVEENGLPASNELEMAVSEYFKVQGVSPHPVAVWALLMPKQLVNAAKSHVQALQGSLLENLDSFEERSPSMQASLAYLIQQGATLHRVLSGGGGWGSKAGLLSLDPATDFGQESLEMPTAFDFGLEMTSELASSVGRLASPGDSVQFFLPMTLPKSVLAEDIQAAPDQQMRFEIGVAVKNEDDFVEDETSDDSKKQIILHSGRFGAMSENGFSLHIDKPGQTVQTKIDLPGASFAVES